MQIAIMLTGKHQAEQTEYKQWSVKQPAFSKTEQAIHYMRLLEVEVVALVTVEVK